MSPKPPFTDLQIETQNSGFYEGYSLPIALVSKISMVLLVIWALMSPEVAGRILSETNGALLNGFNKFYIISVGMFAFLCFIVALIPSTGRRILGGPGTKPEFSNFSWFSMMFGAGLGVGLMVYASAEPLGLWGSNPEILAGNADASTDGSVKSAYRYTFLHYGFHAWAIYVTTGLCLAYYAYSRNMPLTIRSAVTPLLGKYANGIIGHIIDIFGVVATILGVAVTIGFGVSQLVDGIYSVTGMDWLMSDPTAEAPTGSKVGLISALVVIMTMSIISAVSGVDKGIRYLSNLNLVLSLILLLTFVFFGSFAFAMTTYGTALVDYILNFASMSFGAYSPPDFESFSSALPAGAAALSAEQLQGIFATGPWGSFESFKEGLPAEITGSADFEATAMSLWQATEAGRQFKWQSAWTTFYWAWWIAFSPFVGLFLARISKGRSIREFVGGAVIAPALVCFAWMTIVGGTSIDLELSGVAQGSILQATPTNKLFATLAGMLDGGALYAITVMCVVLILTFLITSADSGILVMNTIMAGGSAETGIKHRIIWGIILTLVIASLIIAGGDQAMNALKNAMIIGALPFTFIMVLMWISLIKALFNDHRRNVE